MCVYGSPRHMLAFVDLRLAPGARRFFQGHENMRLMAMADVRVDDHLAQRA
jgi:hypothetical protein